ncbi:hypothetical protein A4A58_28020 [Tardiphaga robiniae]|uniref:Uncharacterized protein n=1 Tax=Tardiphaga robiniae TaxID=943830 RepID=A0A161R1Z7_9BRAD|nr:hypothetical protein A4A58_28020 [Tardiphaga robiniae]
MVMIVIVTAMLVMDMLVMAMTGMTVRVMTVAMVVVPMIVVTVSVIVMSMIMMTVMPMSGRLMRCGIGAAFGIERRLDLDHARAQTLDHFLDHMVAADAQPLGHDLRRQMAVAEMPGEPHQMAGIGTTDFDQRLGSCNHLNETPVFQHQGVAAPQGDGVFEIEQEFQSARPRHRHAATMTIVEIENDGICRRLCPVVLAFDLSRADHELSRLV